MALVFDFVLSSVMCNLPARVSPPSDLENAFDMIQKAHVLFLVMLCTMEVYMVDRKMQNIPTYI